MKAINIGGGEFSGEDWLNLDEFGNPPFMLAADAVFPVGNETVDIVYSSHALEHLSDRVVARMLRQSHRVLKPDGRLVIKIPDFDAVLDAYVAGDLHYFDVFNIPTETWHKRGIPDNVATRTAWLFVGWWNQEYGNPFKPGGAHPERPGAYDIPAAMSQRELEATLALGSPHRIAVALRSYVIEHETGYSFHHQNGWSRREFAQLLETYGFVVTSVNANEIVAANSDIPGIEHMRSISAYYQAYRA